MRGFQTRNALVLIDELPGSDGMVWSDMKYFLDVLVIPNVSASRMIIILKSAEYFNFLPI